MKILFYQVTELILKNTKKKYIVYNKTIKTVEKLTENQNKQINILINAESLPISSTTNYKVTEYSGHCINWNRGTEIIIYKPISILSKTNKDYKNGLKENYGYLKSIKKKYRIFETFEDSTQILILENLINYQH